MLDFHVLPVSTAARWLILIIPPVYRVVHLLLELVRFNKFTYRILELFFVFFYTLVHFIKAFDAVAYFILLIILLDK